MVNIETAWEYFKCSEEVFRVLFGIQELRTKNLFTKKWGKNFDGKNPVGIKIADLKQVNKAIENFRYDVIYINNLMKSKSLAEIKTMIVENGIDMEERFVIKYDITKEELMDAIDHLEENKRICFIYYYGIGRSRVEKGQICKLFNIDESDFESEIDKIELYLSSYIRMKKQSKMQKTTLNSDKNIKNSFKNDFHRPVAYFNPSLYNGGTKKIVLEKKKSDTTDIETHNVTLNDQIIQSNNEIVKEQPDNSEKTIVESKENSEKMINFITSKINAKELSNMERLILYIKLKSMNDYEADHSIIDNYIISNYNYSLDELLNCYINNLDVFDNPNEIIKQVLTYSPKYINLIFNSEYITQMISKQTFDEQIQYYDSLNKIMKDKQKSK